MTAQSYYIPGNSEEKYRPSNVFNSGSNTYYLMHKDIRVARFSMTRSGLAPKILEVYSPTHMPIGVRGFTQPLLNLRFASWKKNRHIPSERPNIESITDATDLSLGMIENINMGVSLTDCYWFMPVDKDYKWRDVNYYNNEFSTDIGDIAINNIIASDINLKTPDITTNGVLPKMWLTISNKTYLLKVGASKKNQEVCNEVFASLVAARLGIDVVPYYLSKLQDGTRCALCENFLKNPNTEFVSMQQVSVEKGTLGRNGVLEFMQDNGMNTFLSKMIVLDFLVANQDRHLGNFGFIRDASTMNIIKPAPLFDFDQSMNVGLWNSDYLSNDIAKPFAATHMEQMMFVSDISWIDLTDLENNYENDITTIYGEAGFSQAEISRLKEFFSERILLLVQVLEVLQDKIKKEMQKPGYGGRNSGRSSLSHDENGVHNSTYHQKPPNRNGREDEYKQSKQSPPDKFNNHKDNVPDKPRDAPYPRNDAPPAKDFSNAPDEYDMDETFDFDENTSEEINPP